MSVQTQVANYEMSKEFFDLTGLGNFGGPAEAPQTHFVWVQDGGDISYASRTDDYVRSGEYPTIQPAYDMVWILNVLPAVLPTRDKSVSWNLNMWKTLKNLEGEPRYSMDYTAGTTDKMYFGSIDLEADTAPDAALKLLTKVLNKGLINL